MRGDEKRSSVIIIGIAGGSGSGKTTFARMMQTHLSDQFCGWLGQDRYYRDHPPELRGMVNYDHPESLEFELMAQHLKELRSGRDIQVPEYDFTTHSRKPALTHFPVRPLIIVDGILLLTQANVRAELDFSFFIDTDEEVRFQRRLYRDVRERGRTPDGVERQFRSQVKPMHDLYVEPSRRFADRVISGERSFTPVIEEIVYGFKTPSLKEPAGP